MDKRVRIACEGAAAVPLDQLTETQGSLKDLSKENYAKLRKEILELGFSEPVGVWREKGEHGFTLRVLSGHQRCRVLREMRDREGFEVPPVPVNWIEADGLQQAKRKVLALTSQYGEITRQGLYEFVHDASILMPELAESFRFPEINFERFAEEFYPQPSSDMHPANEASEDKTANNKCPACGHDLSGVVQQH